MEYLAFLAIEKMVKVNHKIDFSRGTYGVRRWQYENFDCMDLYIELLIIINCEIIDRYRPCRLFLKWIVQLLIHKWDTIRYIEFEEALRRANYLKILFSKSFPMEHFKLNRKFLKCMIRHVKKNKKGKTAKDILFNNNFFFMDSINKHLQTREIIYNILANNDDLYNVKNV